MTELYTENGVENISGLIISGPGQKKEMVQKRCKFNVPIYLRNFSDVDAVLENLDYVLNIEEKKSDEKNLTLIQEYLDLYPERLTFGREVDKLFCENGLELVWCKDSKDFAKNKKTRVIQVNNFLLDNYGGKIGLRWKY